MAAADLFREGRLDEAIAEQVEAVKTAPADLGRRTFLFELYAFAGDLERAARQLSVIEGQSSELSLAAGAYRQCLEGEAARRRVYGGEGEPHFLGEPPQHVRRHAEALRLLAADRLDEARALLTEAATERSAVHGEVNGSAFSDFRDADDILGPVFEFFEGPLYCWIPISSVRSLKLTAPKKPRDLLWNNCELILVDESEHSGVMPVLYPNSHESDDPIIRLGRQTDWIGFEDGPTFGLGMRTFLVAGEERGMLEISELQFAVDGAAGTTGQST